MTDIALPTQPRPAIFDIGNDYIIVREADEVGLQFFAKYRLIKPTP